MTPIVDSEQLRTDLAGIQQRVDVLLPRRSAPPPDPARDSADRAAYFVDRLRRLRALEAIAPVARAFQAFEEYEEQLAERRHEIRELQGRLGFSVRRQVNERLRALGLPEVAK